MSGYEVKRSITVKAPPAEVYKRIVDLHEWPAWSPWEGLDPNMTKNYEGAPSGVGSSYTWKGNRKVGEGRMTITDAAAPKSVGLDLEFLKPFKSTSKTVLALEPISDGTRVEWTMTGEYNALMKVMSFFMPMDKLVGKDFEKGLAQLKAAVEA